MKLSYTPRTDASLTDSHRGNSCNGKDFSSVHAKCLPGFRRTFTMGRPTLYCINPWSWGPVAAFGQAKVPL